MMGLKELIFGNKPENGLELRTVNLAYEVVRLHQNLPESLQDRGALLPQITKKQVTWNKGDVGGKERDSQQWNIAVPSQGLVERYGIENIITDDFIGDEPSLPDPIVIIKYRDGNEHKFSDINQNNRYQVLDALLEIRGRLEGAIACYKHSEEQDGRRYVSEGEISSERFNSLLGNIYRHIRRYQRKDRDYSDYGTFLKTPSPPPNDAPGISIQRRRHKDNKGIFVKDSYVMEIRHGDDSLKFVTEEGTESAKFRLLETDGKLTEEGLHEILLRTQYSLESYYVASGTIR